MAVRRAAIPSQSPGTAALIGPPRGRAPPALPWIWRLAARPRPIGHACKRPFAGTVSFCRVAAQRGGIDARFRIGRKSRTVALVGPDLMTWIAIGVPWIAA